MLWLVFRHLIPMNYLLPSQKETINNPDLHGRSSEKFLSLVPICCIEASLNNSAKDANQISPFSLNYSSNNCGSNQAAPNYKTSTPSSSTAGSVSLPTFLVGMGRTPIQEGLVIPNSDKQKSDPPSETFPLASTASSSEYHHYLVDARNAVRQRYEATKCWLYLYDGISPPPHALIVNPLVLGDKMSEIQLTDDEMSSPRGPVSLTEEENKDFWKLMGENVDSDMQEKFGHMSICPADPCEEALVLTKDQFQRVELAEGVDDCECGTLGK